jgi:hypothetical protein
VAIGGVVINFAARTADAVRDVGKLTRELGDLDGKADGVGGNLKKGLAVGAAAVGTAMLGAGAAMLDFAQAAGEDAAEAENLANTLETIPGITDDMIRKNAEWIDSMQLATNVADTDLRQAVSKLTLATGNLGDAQDLTKIAVDAAAGSGKSLKTVTDAMAKAVAGNTGALQKQFPWLDANKDGTLTLDEAMDGLKGAYKDAATEVAKQKPWETLNTVIGEIQEKLGEKFLPYLQDLATWLKDPKNQKKLDEWIEGFGDFTDVLVDLAGAVSATASEFGKVFAPFKSAWNSLPEWLQNWIKDGMPIIPYSNTNKSRGSVTSTSPSQPRTTTASSLYVTDEQVYRAVNQLILRGDTRNGRAQLAVP